jgi:hypothetical protein
MCGSKAPVTNKTNMKLTRKEVERMRELNAKAAGDRTDDEKKELSAILMKALNCGEDVTKLLGDDLDLDKMFNRSVDLNDDDTLTADAVKKLVTDSVTDAIKSKGVTADVINSLEAKLDGLQSLKAEDIKSAIAEVLGGHGNDVDIKAAIEEGMKSFKPADSVSKADFDKAIEDLKKSFVNKGQKNVFGMNTMISDVQIEFPTNHRAGNLNVAEKQLLNIMLNGTPGMKQHQLEEIRDNGIPASTLKFAAESGNRQLQILRKSITYGHKTLTAGSANNGAELIATDLSSELLTRMYMESPIAAEFVASEIDMPTNSFQIPILTTRPTFKKGSENPGSNPTESSPGTDADCSKADRQD